MRAGSLYRCPQCGESPAVPVGGPCPRCRTPMVDEHGRPAPPEQVVQRFAPTWAEMGAATFIGVAGGLATLALVLWLGDAAPHRIGVLHVIGPSAAAGALVAIAFGVRRWWDALRGRGEREALARMVEGHTPTAPGVHATRGRVHVLRSIGEDGGLAVAVSRRDGIVEAGRFAVVGEGEAALVDDDWLEVVGAARDVTVVEGDLVDVVGPLDAVPSDADLPLPGYRDGVPFVVYGGRPGAPVRVARVTVVRHPLR